MIPYLVYSLTDLKIPTPLIINEKYLKEYFEHFDFILKQKKDISVLLALSGGSDSMLLLYLLLRYFKGNKGTIKIAHINHNLRNKLLCLELNPSIYFFLLYSLLIKYSISYLLISTIQILSAIY